MGEIAHRDVYFCPGYDVQGVRRYHRYLQRQCGWYARRFDAAFEVGPLRASGIEGWLVADVQARWPDGTVNVRYHFCNWRKDVVRGFAPSRTRRYLRLFAAWARIVFHGHFFRLARYAPRFLTAAAIPLIMMIARGLLLMMVALALLAGPIATALSLIAAFAGLKLLQRGGEHAYEDFFVNGFMYLEDRLSYRPDPADGRLEVAVGSLTAHLTREAGHADEVLIAGHSYGAAPAMKIASAVAAAGRPVSLLTAGSIASFVSLDRKEGPLRSALGQMLMQENVIWREYFAPQDTLCFSQSHPLRDLKLNLSRRPRANFKVRTAIFGKVVAARKIRKFRWNLLRMHFQFLMAVDVQGGFDWHRFTLGPEPLNVSAE